jgi:hypothetical protein
MSSRRPDASQVELSDSWSGAISAYVPGYAQTRPPSRPRLPDQPCFCPFSRRARMLVVVARGEGGFGAAALRVDTLVGSSGLPGSAGPPSGSTGTNSTSHNAHTLPLGRRSPRCVS